jgi:hypothetical protein
MKKHRAVDLNGIITRKNLRAAMAFFQTENC